MSQWCKVKNAETGWGAGQICNGWFTVKEVREAPDGVYAKVQPSHRFIMEELVEHPEETALNRHVRKRLRKAMDQLQAEEKKEVDVAEVFSPPRVVPVAKQKGLNPGGSFDLKNGYDLRSEQDRRRMWKALREQQPLMILLSPPCTAFCKLQSLSYPKMDWGKAITLLNASVEDMELCAGIMRWQHRRGRLFAFEQPDGSKAWEEKPIQGVREMDGVMVVVNHRCAFRMNVDGIRLQSSAAANWAVAAGAIVADVR